MLRDRGELVAVVSMDLSKAFDEGLWYGRQKVCANKELSLW